MIAFITGKAPDSQSVRMLIHQLIEQQILFDGWEKQTLPALIPADLTPYDALIIDEDILRQASPGERERVEKYASKKYVWINSRTADTGHASDVEQSMEVNINLFAAQADLKPETFPEISDREIIRGAIARMEDFRQWQLPHICEYHLHVTEGAMALENTPYAPENWSAKIDDSLRKVFDMLSADGDHDQLCGASLMNLCARRCNMPEAVDKLFAVADRLLEIRPRTAEGILSMAGNRRDPLFFSGMETPFFGNNGYTTVGRNMVNNELFHFSGGVFSACAAAGRPELLNEALRLMKHIDQVHRDRDGLFFHASVNGKAFGSKWGRGNTHAMLGAFYMLRRYPEMPEVYRVQVVDFLKKSLEGFRNVQTASGLWHNILDDASTPEETSCSVLVTYISSWCINHGFLAPGSFLPMIARCRSALKRKFWHGFGSGNCIGTMPAVNNPGYYRRRRMHMYMMPLIVPALLESAKALELSTEK